MDISLSKHLNDKVYFLSLAQSLLENIIYDTNEYTEIV